MTGDAEPLSFDRPDSLAMPFSSQVLVCAEMEGPAAIWEVKGAWVEASDCCMRLLLGRRLSLGRSRSDGRAVVKLVDMAEGGAERAEGFSKIALTELASAMGEVAGGVQSSRTAVSGTISTCTFAGEVSRTLAGDVSNIPAARTCSDVLAVPDVTIPDAGPGGIFMLPSAAESRRSLLIGGGRGGRGWLESGGLTLPEVKDGRPSPPAVGVKAVGVEALAAAGGIMADVGAA